jgi:histone H3/H4
MSLEKSEEKILVRLPINTLKKIAKQNGVKRISYKALCIFTLAVEHYAIELIQKAKELSNHANRTTVLDRDVEKAKNFIQTAKTK